MLISFNVWLKDLSGFKALSKEISKAGFNGVELSLDYPLCFEEDIPRYVIDALNVEGLTLGIHLPWRDIALASPIEYVREASLKAVSQCLNKIRGLKIEYVLTHVTTDQVECGYKDLKCIESGRKSLEFLIEEVKELGTKLLVETTRSRCCSRDDQLSTLLKDLKDVGVCLDIPHLIEQRYRRLKSLPTINNLFKELPPDVLERTSLIHFHGYSLTNEGFVSHIKPKEDQVGELLDAIISLSNRRDFIGVVLEVFKDETSKSIEPKDLKYVVKRLKFDDT